MDSLPTLLDVQKSRWSVRNEQGARILTCIWFLGENSTLVLVGLLAMEEFEKYGGEAFVDFSLTMCINGELQRISNRFISLLEVTWPSIYLNLPASQNRMVKIRGILQTGLSAHEN